MRQEHRGGEKLFIDYSDGLSIVDTATGELMLTQLCVAVWGASNYTYAEATMSQTLPEWISSHNHAFEYFGCVPRVMVPDNLKSGVSKACKYEPDLNPTYRDMAEYYGCAVLPARPRKPRDKAIVENGVLISQRSCCNDGINCLFSNKSSGTEPNGPTSGDGHSDKNISKYVYRQSSQFLRRL
jgi:transposase